MPELSLDMSEGCLWWGWGQLRDQRSGALTLFAAGADGVHVPQRLHEGGVNLELPTRC